jgi:hypothetical protein
MPGRSVSIWWLGGGEYFKHSVPRIALGQAGTSESKEAGSVSAFFFLTYSVSTFSFWLWRSGEVSAHLKAHSVCAHHG